MPEEGTNAASAVLPSFVDVLVPDPSQLPSLQVFMGFSGRSVEDDLVRLYQSFALDAYVEVRREDIVHTLRLGPSLNAATVMWLKRDARIVHVTPRREESGSGNLGCWPLLMSH